MLIGFKRVFAPFVREGSKNHTIRAIRADGKIPAIGEALHCYADTRQKTMELLGRWPCARVESIAIAAVGGMLLKAYIEGRRLEDEELALFLWRDGFRSYRGNPIPEGNAASIFAAREFWNERLAEPWNGRIIHWDYRHPVDAPKSGKKRGAIA